MSLAEPPKGSCYIWAVSTFLFLSIVSGGAFLVLYMTRPETPTTSWYPIIGIGLVCLPWFFWFLTFIYRILSRTFGFRMVCWGTNVYPVDSVRIDGGSSTGDDVADSLANGNTSNGDSTNEHRQVHFGEAVVVTEGGNNRDNPPSHGGSITPARASHESETPLKLSMAS